MKPRRTVRTVRLTSHTLTSVGRIRPRRNTSSRKRPTPKYLPKKLKQIRESLGMSQSEIARALGVKDRSTISGYERGEREPPLPTVLAYARLASVPMETLVDDKLTLPS